jgi:hypothetical protein
MCNYYSYEDSPETPAADESKTKTEVKKDK